MAGGDHLHFSILVNGIFVTPLEWWDKQWLKLNIDDILYGNSAKYRNF
jgi:murein DD-endopeptidase MepM/ murein hydrolase activator NlpD